MGRRRNVTAGERGALGLAIVAVVGALWWSGEQRSAAALTLTVLLPYLAAYAPLPCGAGWGANGRLCSTPGAGLLIGCPAHRWERVWRIRRPERISVPIEGTDPVRPVITAPSSGRLRTAPAATPVCSRSRRADRLLAAGTAVAVVVGWVLLAAG